MNLRWLGRIGSLLLIAAVFAAGTARTDAQIVFDDITIRQRDVEADLRPVPFNGTCSSVGCTAPSRGRLEATTSIVVETVGDRPVPGIRLLLDASLQVTRFGAPAGASVRREGPFVFLAFDPPLLPNSSTTMTLTYAGNPAWIWDELVLVGEGLLYPVAMNRSGDIAANYAPIKLNIKMPAGYVTASLGPGRGQEGSGTVTSEWHSDGPVPQLSVVALRTDRQAERMAGPIKLRIMSRPSAEVDADAIADLVSKVAGFNSRLLFTFPLSELTVVVAPFPRAAFGFGTPGVLVLSEAAFSGDSANPDRVAERVLSLAHEMAHTYYPLTSWGRGQASLWLTEGLAQYLSFMAVESLLGRDAFSQVASTYREAYAKVAMSFRCTRPFCNEDLPLGWIDRSNARTPEAFPILQSKGPLVLHMLRHVMGSEKFQQMLGSFAQRYRGRPISVVDLELAANAVYGEDLVWFFQEWVMERILPDYVIPEAVSRPVADGYQTVIRIRNEGTGEMPVDVLLTTDRGEALLRRFPVPGMEGETLVTVTTQQRVVRVEVDPEKWVLQWDYSNDTADVR
jgi:CheY-like chemotaxis protein